MSRHFSVEASERSSQSQHLHPALQSALASLDVQLDEELARYRRQRGKRSAPATRSLGRSQPRKSLDLIAIQATGGRTHPYPVVDSTQPELTPTDSQAVNLEQQGTNSSTTATPTAASLDSFALLVVTNSHAENSFTDLAVHANIASDREDLVAPANHLGPDDYLESSEELLRSLAEEEAKVRAERSFMQSLLTPLGVGSMLLLILASTAFGYIIMNPSSLSSFSFGWSGTSNRDTTKSGQNEADTGENIEVAGIPSALNLSQQEFRSLNLDNISMAKGNPDKVTPLGTMKLSKPKAPSAPKVAVVIGANEAERENSEPTIAASTTSLEDVQPAVATKIPIKPAPVRRSTPIKPYNPPAPRREAVSTPQVYAPRATQPAPAPAIPEASAPESQSNSADYQYKVVTPYDSDRSLEQAQKVVPDAYVKNFSDGARIQMGAFNDEAEAQQRVQQLQKQGVSAEVYRQ